MKSVAIVQSNYIPWKGYFDLIAAVDEFIIYDDMQFTKRDWRNRNQIKTPSGMQWLTVPVRSKGRFEQSIRDTEIDGVEWANVHWEAIVRNYRRAPFFKEVSEMLAPVYCSQISANISELNRFVIELICKYLGVKTVLSNSWDYSLAEGRSERLVQLCIQAGADRYISGPSARGYIDSRVFSESGISLEWFDYSSYLEYPQLWGDFVHNVSIIDLLFNCGPQSPRYMKYVHW